MTDSYADVARNDGAWDAAHPEVLEAQRAEPVGAIAGPMLSTEEACEILSINASTLRKGWENGHFPGAIKTEPDAHAHKGRWLWPEAEVKAMIGRGMGKTGRARRKDAGTGQGRRTKQTKPKIMRAKRVSRDDSVASALLEAKKSLALADRAVNVALSVHEKRQARLKEAME